MIRRPGSPPSRRLVAGALLALLLAANLPYMYATMFSSFASYDDEGYLLLTTRDFIRGGGLYTDLFTAYGPFYFAYEYLSYGAGTLDVTHDLNRLFTLGEWSACVILCALLVLEITGSLTLAAAGCVLAIPAASALANEPGHPQGILLVLLSASLLLAIRAANGDRRLSWFFVGALLAAIALTKVNAGVFAILAFGVAIARYAPRNAWSRIGMLCAAVAAGALPFVLMRAHLDSWAAPYCIAVTAAIASVVIAAPPVRALLSAGQVKALLFGAAFCSICSVAFLAMRGTAPRDLISGWTTVAAHLASVFNIPAPIGFDAVPAALFSFVFALLYVRVRRSSDVRNRKLFVAVKLAYGLCAVLTVAMAQRNLAAYGAEIGLLGPFVWLVCATDAEAPANMNFARHLLAAAAALQLLIAYPIAGSQLQMSTFLILPVALICISDALVELRILASLAARPKLQTFASLAIAGVLIAISLTRDSSAWKSYQRRTPLNLPGASRIRIEHERAAEYQWLIANLRAHADRFVSLPGLFSLNLWSGIEPVTRRNAETWMTLLTDEQQRTIASRLLRIPRACAVVTEYRFWTGGRDYADTPLMRTLAREFVPSGLRTGTFEIRERRSPYRGVLPNYLLFGSHEFRSDADRMAAPAQFVTGDPVTIELRFRTTEAGALLSAQDETSGAPRRRGIVLYVGTDGRMRGGRGATMLVTPFPVADGRWHRVVFSGTGSSETLQVDGAPPTEQNAGPAPLSAQLHCVIGSGFSTGLPAAPGGWFPFHGDIADIVSR